MEDLYLCMQKQNINYTSVRESIYKLFLEKKHVALSATEIVNILNQKYPKKISINTVYRHLRVFLECKLILSVHDNVKTTYYFLSTKNSVFQICTQCSQVQKTDREVCHEFQDADFITVHKKCKKCLLNLNKGS